MHSLYMFMPRGYSDIHEYMLNAATRHCGLVRRTGDRGMARVPLTWSFV